MTYFMFISVCCFIIVCANCQDIETKKVTKIPLVGNAEVRKNVTVQVRKAQKLVCPRNPRIPFFSLPCESSKECAIFGQTFVCCKLRCIKGVVPPKPEVKHSPILFGWVDRVCPVDPLMEIFDVKECHTDVDCLPRICCPDTTGKGQGKSYCRTAAAKLDRIPVARSFIEPLKNMMSYLQCTQPPPPVLDLFPKACRYPLDCFPNLCCQEGAHRYCRPPKRSLVTLVVSTATRIGSSEVVKRLVERVTV